MEQISSGGTVTYLHHDQQGSTRLLTGSTGTVTGKCTYGAYGTPTCEGTTTTPLDYDGQYTSSDTGLIYLRARTYDPATAQFLTVDPLVAITGAPYNYAGDNPLNASDPTGLLFGVNLPSWEEAGQMRRDIRERVLLRMMCHLHRIGKQIRYLMFICLARGEAVIYRSNLAQNHGDG